MNTLSVDAADDDTRSFDESSTSGASSSAGPESIQARNTTEALYTSQDSQYRTGIGFYLKGQHRAAYSGRTTH